MKKLLILFVALVAGCCHCPKPAANESRGYAVINGAVGNEVLQPNDPRSLSARGYITGYKGSCNVIHTDGICPDQETP